jgi:3-hydroxyisobutyrate dehydrogenase-like beta-hydroxyacid dehydrogenase
VLKKYFFGTLFKIRAMQVAGKLIAEKNYTPMFPIDLVEKDFSYAEKVSSGALIKLNHKD